MLRVLVVGGGIGGLAAAIVLREQGFDALVLEQAPELAEAGAGVAIAPNGMKALTHLRCDTHVRETGSAANEMVWFDLQDGRRLFATQLGTEGRSRYGDDWVTVHRADLLDALLARVPGEALRLGTRVVGFKERPHGVVAWTERGEVIEGDLLVGADGLRSLVREALFGVQEARFTGIVGWRAVFPVANVPSVPVIHASTSWLGPGRTIVFYPVRNDELFNFVAWVPAEEVNRESWALSGDVAELRASLSDACDELATIVDAIEEAFLTPIYFRDPLDTWGTERVVLLGDAAHPAIPFTGNGASMALEDAVTLGGVLGKHAPDGVPAAIAEYGRRRIPRTTRLQTVGRMNMRFLTERDPDQLRARNGRFQGMAQLDPVGETPWGWIYGHDAAAALDQPVEALAQKDIENPMRRPESQRAFDLWRTALEPEDHAEAWVGQRAGYERFLGRIASPPAHVVVDELDCAGVPCLRVGAGTNCALLHLHGGGFVMGSARSAIELAARLAKAADGWALVPDYRRAPEHAFPAALEDAASAYRWLAGLSTPVVVTGEDAGGGLAVSLAVALRDAEEPLPEAIYVVSPFCDLTLSAPSIRTAVDPWLDRDFLTLLAASYIHDVDAATPLVSPVLADLAALPPLLVHAAAGEALRDDAVRIAARAPSAQLRLFEDTVHSFVVFDFLPETREALAEFGQHARG